MIENVPYIYLPVASMWQKCNQVTATKSFLLYFDRDGYFKLLLTRVSDSPIDAQIQAMRSGRSSYNGLYVKAPT